MKNLKAALVAGDEDRSMAFATATTKEAHANAIEDEVSAVKKVQAAFLEDTKDFNRADHAACVCPSDPWLRALVKD
jgi:hypothetical protein